jgi:hypothetical protein
MIIGEQDRKYLTHDLQTTHNEIAELAQVEKNRTVST